MAIDLNAVKAARLLAVVSVGALAGCGGGSKDKSDPPLTHALNVKPRTQVVVEFGADKLYLNCAVDTNFVTTQNDDIYGASTSTIVSPSLCASIENTIAKHPTSSDGVVNVSHLDCVTADTPVEDSVPTTLGSLC